MSAAAEKKIKPEFVKAIFRDQIEATTAVEHALLAAWKLNPKTAAIARTDLLTLRATIDQLNVMMVEEIAMQWDYLTSTSCRDHLDRAQKAVIGARRLNNLYQQALTRATHSYCEAELHL